MRAFALLLLLATTEDRFAVDLLGIKQGTVRAQTYSTANGCIGVEDSICYNRCIDRNWRDLQRGYTIVSYTCSEISPGMLACGCTLAPPGPYYPPVYWPGPLAPGPTP